MSVKSALKNLIVAMGGTPTGKRTEDLIDEIAALKDPLFKLKVEVFKDNEADLLGKTVDELQENVTIKDGVVSGVLFYVDDYTGFSGDPAEQVGNYLVVKASVPGETGVTISVSKDGGEPKNLDEDGILVFRTSNTMQNLTFTASKTSLASASKTIKLRGLTLKKA